MISFIKNFFLKIENKCKVGLEILLKYLFILVSYVSYPLLWPFKCNEDIVIAPAIGDIVEKNDDGARNMVAFVGIENDMYDIRMFSGLESVVGRRGRAKRVLTVEKLCSKWPPEDSTVYRDGKVIHPMSNFKLSKIRILNALAKYLNKIIRR